MKNVCPRETSKSRGSTTEKEKRPGKGVISGRVPERVTSVTPTGELLSINYASNLVPILGKRVKLSYSHANSSSTRAAPGM